MSSNFKKCYTNSKSGAKSTNPLVFCVPIFYDKNINTGGIGFNSKPFCNATPGSNGVDSITMYVYDKLIISGSVNKLAYVECDYVE